MSQDNGETLYSELMLGVDGETDCPSLFHLVYDALAEGDNDAKLIAFSACLGLYETRLDLCIGHTEAGQQCSAETGWQLVYRDIKGRALWYYPAADTLALVRQFFK